MWWQNNVKMLLADLGGDYRKRKRYLYSTNNWNSSKFEELKWERKIILQDYDFYKAIVFAGPIDEQKEWSNRQR